MNQLGCGSYDQMTTYIKQLKEIYINDDKIIKNLSNEISVLKDQIYSANFLKRNRKIKNHLFTTSDFKSSYG